MCFDSILDLLPAGHPWSLFDGWASKVASQVVRPMTIKTVIHRSYIDAYRSDIHQLLTYLQNFIVFTWISPPMLGTMVDPRPEIGCGKDGWTIWLIDGDIGKLSLYSHLSQCYTELQTIARWPRVSGRQPVQNGPKTHQKYIVYLFGEQRDWGICRLVRLAKGDGGLIFVRSLTGQGPKGWQCVLSKRDKILL